MEQPPSGAAHCRLRHCDVSAETEDIFSLDCSTAFSPLRYRRTKRRWLTNNNHLLSDLGRRIAESSGDDRETWFLFQRISVVVQRFNSVLLHDSFSVYDHAD